MTIYNGLPFDSGTVFRILKTMRSLLFAIAAASLIGCADEEQARLRHQSEIATRIANACMPYPDERRVVEWAIDEQGEKVLSVTVLKFAGRRHDVLQYTIISAEEIRQ